MKIHNLKAMHIPLLISETFFLHMCRERLFSKSTFKQKKKEEEKKEKQMLTC